MTVASLPQLSETALNAPYSASAETAAPIPTTQNAGIRSHTPTDIPFDPDKHLIIEEPEWTKRLSDFGYDNKLDGISEVAATAPFGLFTDEAIRLMRQELLSEAVQTNFVRSTKRSPCVVRGYANHCSRFIHDAWTHPLVLRRISKAAGIDLIPVMDYEIGHTNIQLGPKGLDGVRDLGPIPTPPLPPSEELEKSEYDSRPVDDWHKDSVPFVAVLMLSNTNGMKGGETAVKNKDDTISVVPGPAMGKVVVMQGATIRHSALRATNCAERIAMVTSFRPADPLLPDSTKIHGLRKSDASDVDLGFQWLTYRLKLVEDRCRIQRERLLSGGSEAIDRKAIIRFSEELNDTISYTVQGLFDDISTLPPVY